MVNIKIGSENSIFFIFKIILFCKAMTFNFIELMTRVLMCSFFLRYLVAVNNVYSQPERFESMICSMPHRVLADCPDILFNKAEREKRIYQINGQS